MTNFKGLASSRTLKLLAAVISLTTLLVSTPAYASFQALGDPIDGGSWFQEWTTTTDYAFNEFQFEITFNGSFAPDPLQDFSREGWSLKTISDDWLAVWAMGDRVEGQLGERLEFLAHYAGELSDPLTMRWVTYDVGTRQRSGGLMWNGNDWNSFTSDWDPGSQYMQIVPEPATMLLSGLGLMMMSATAIRRRLRK